MRNMSIRLIRKGWLAEETGCFSAMYMKNAMVPYVTSLCMQLGSLLSPKVPWYWKLFLDGKEWENYFTMQSATVISPQPSSALLFQRSVW